MVRVFLEHSAQSVQDSSLIAEAHSLDESFEGSATRPHAVFRRNPINQDE